MGDFEHGTPPSGRPAWGQGSPPPQTFEPEPVAEQTFDRVPYSPAYGAPAQEETFDRVPELSAHEFAGQQQPSYQQPSYQQPSYQQPSYHQPSYHQPSYQQPSYQQSGPQSPAPWDYVAPRTASAQYVPPVNWSPASTARNWLGIVSIVFAVLGGGLVGVIFGWRGVVAAREGRATNGAMARWGVILNVAVPLVIAGVFFGVIDRGTSDGSSRSQWEALAVGDCLAPSDQTRDGARVFEPVPTGCEGQHWSQVYFKGVLTEDASPGSAALGEQLRTACVSKEALIHLDRTRIPDVYPTIIVPTKDSWAAGDRSVVCLVSDVDGSISGSWVVGY